MPWALVSGGRGIIRPRHLLDAPEEAHGEDHDKKLQESRVTCQPRCLKGKGAICFRVTLS